MVLLDGLQGFNSAFDSPADLVWKESLPRLMANGPGFGVSVIATADRPGAVPGPIAGLVADRLVFRLADPYDYASFGLRPPSGRVPPGRAIDARTGRELQVACFERTLEEEVAAVAAAAAPTIRPPQPIGVLPSRISITELIGGVGLENPDWHVPVGIGDDALEPVTLRLAPGEPVLIAGGPRSGRSTMLLTIARVVGRCSRGVTMGAMALGRVSSARSPRVRAPRHLFRRHRTALRSDEIAEVGAVVDRRCRQGRGPERGAWWSSWLSILAISGW